MSLRRERRLERDGLLTFIRPAGDRPPERPRKTRESVPRQERRGPRSVTVASDKRLTRVERWDWADAEGAILASGIKTPVRPSKFSKRCHRGPCPFVSCRNHNYLDVDPETGAIKINFPGKDPTELKDPCAKRLGRRAAKNGVETPVKRVARALNVTSERVRQIERGAIVKLRVLLDDDMPMTADRLANMLPIRSI